MHLLALVLTSGTLLGLTGCLRPDPGSAASDTRAAGNAPRATIIGRRGLAPGEFFKPRAVSLDAAGRLFVIDRSGWVQRLAPDGAPERRWRLPAWDNGTPTSLKIDAAGDLWIADTHYGRILIYSPDGELLRQFGEQGDGPGQMIFPTDLALDGTGTVYVTEYGVKVRVLKFTEQGEFIEEWNPRDPATGEELLMRPMGIVWEPERRDLLIADSCHHRLVRMSTVGEITAVIGREGRGPGEFRYPYDLALGPAGDIYVVEYENARVQRLRPDGTPVAAWGRQGRAVGELWSPWGVAVRAEGDVIVADTENHRLQVFADSER